MYKDFYDNIILGGTYSALGFCEGNKGNNLIISKNIYIEDFSPSFRVGRAEAVSEEGEALLKRIEVREGIANTAQASIEMYKLAMKNKQRVLYQTFVSQVSKCCDGYTVKVHNWDGTNIIRCKNVINTQPDKNIVKKTFNALAEGDIPVGDYEGYSIAPAFYKEQRILKINTAPACTMDTARLRLFELLHSDRLSHLRLILTSTEFDYNVSGASESEIPCCNFENLIEGFEKGYAMGVSL